MIDEKNSVPYGGKYGLGVGYPITTPHKRDPVTGKRKVQTPLDVKTAKPWLESMVGLVEAGNAQTRKQYQEERKFYPESR